MSEVSANHYELQMCLDALKRNRALNLMPSEVIERIANPVFKSENISSLKVPYWPI